jgi:tight adherence protein C
VIAALLSLLFLISGRKQRAERVLARLERIEENAGPRETASRRDGLRSVLVRFLELPARLLPSALVERLSADLQRYSGTPGVDLPRLFGLRCYAAIFLPTGTLLMLRFSALSALAAPIAFAAGAAIPVAMAASKRRRYLDEARAAIPDICDILYAFVLGGRNLDQAFSAAASSAAEPLHSLFETALRKIELGTVRAEAFEDMIGRCPVQELALLLRSLVEAERRGHQLSDTLAVFSRELRLKRRDQLRVVVAKAPLKLLAPLVFLILPASILLTVGPVVLLTLKHGF